MEMTQVSPSKIMIKSDSGRMYDMRLRGENKGTIECTCQGFKFKRDCKHVKFVKEQLAKNSGKKVRIATIKDPFDFIEPYKEQFTRKLGV